MNHILNNRHTNTFQYGTIFQSFLSSVTYHRWNSPVDGTITDIVHVPGTYYSETQNVGYDDDGPTRSQAYLAEVATRVLIFIKADSDLIGDMCFAAVGMVEVSSCEVEVKVGQKVKKGEELGMFHFGGSTYLLIFRQETHLAFCLRDVNDHPVTPGETKVNIPINRKIAKAVSLK